MMEINFTIPNILLILALLAYKINVSRSYKQIFIEDDGLCSPMSIRNVSLETDELSGLIVTLRNMSKLREHAQKWGNTNDFICEFRVKGTDKDDGIFAVIQNIAFRKDKITNECLDYIEYRAVNSTFRSKKYCGQMDTDRSLTFSPSDLTPASNSFVEPNDVLDVYINISKEPLRPYRILELQIVFTSFRFCFHELFVDDQPCSSNHRVHCIHKKFIHDGYINCPYPGCVDEEECIQKVPKVTKKSILSVETIGLIGLLATILFVSGIWFGCKIKKRNNENIITTRSSDNNHFIEMEPVPEFTDHPPSYESLFPSQPSS